MKRLDLEKYHIFGITFLDEKEALSIVKAIYAVSISSVKDLFMLDFNNNTKEIHKNFLQDMAHTGLLVIKGILNF